METESQVEVEVKELFYEVADLWNKGMLHEVDKLVQYTFRNPGETESHNVLFPIHMPTKHEILEIKEVSEYSADIRARVTGPCTAVGNWPNCTGCGRGIMVEYWMRYMRESGPYKPDKRAKFGLNLDSITILSDDRCTSREKTDCEFTEEKQDHPANT